MPTPQSSSVAVDDPASSLRAAALLTLKSKRKRAVVETAPPPSTRPLPVEDTLQLDYGQEETPSNVPLSPSHSGSNEILNELHPTNDIEEGQIREEGEISDEDEASASPSKPPPSPEYFHAGPSDAHASPAKQLPARPSPPAAGSPRFPALLERITDAPQYIPMDEDQPMNAEDSAMQEYSPVDDIPLLVDLDHVRPGIPLKLEEYNVAKDIILDLLGWGVEPEYLIDCGLTRQIVYYVFAELNLELPHNLDTSDLVPFTPEVATVTLTRQMPTVHEKPSSGQSLLTRLNLGSHIPRLVTPPPDSMEGVQSPGTNELLDIERQRRQELLARKAAQASRKAKQVAPPVEDTSSVASSAGISPSEPSKDQDMETTPVASEAVEDFLKSIATPVEPPFKPTSITTLQVKENGMDLDEIPGLGSLSRSSSQADVTGNAPAYTDQIVVSPSTIHPLVSAESANSIFSPIAQDATIAANSFVTQRRGAKRPVASDFVDLDPSQRVGPNGNRLLDVPSRPGTGANFSSVSMKRCVIDLSDSEGEQDRSAAIPMKRARSKGYVSPPRRLRNETPSGSGWNTPSVAPTSSAAPGGQSVLEFKIKQMKEEIARREQEMKRAIASRPVSTAGSSNTTSIGASAPTAVVVKQEEDDSLTSTAMQTDDIEINAQSSETQSLDPSIVPLAMSENPSTNVSVAGTPSIAENDSRRGSASWPVSSPSPTTQDQDSEGEGLHGQAGSVTSSSNEERQQVQQSLEPETSQQVDVDQEMSTSAEVPQITSALPKQDGRHAPSPALSCETENLFTTYASPFEWYPLLHSHSRTISGQLTPIEQTSSSSSSNSVSNAPVFPASLSSAVFPVSSVYPSSLSHPSIPTSSSSSSSSSNFPLPNLKPLKLTAAAKLLDPCKRICQYEVPGGGVCRDAGCKDLHLSRTLGPSTGGVSGIGGFEPNDQDAAEYLFNTLPADWLSGHGISSSKILTALQEVRLKNMPIAFEERVAQALCALGPPPLPPPAT